ncbi:MAG: hypothetical protein WBA05_15955 [Gordonia sp. (in: high G+C Gram-positive bacteria)]|uniref:hypothetical protein n=1 Tax=Gordonia TaxID=2053 RepID=UPI003267F711
MTAPEQWTESPASAPKRPDTIRLGIQLWFAVIALQILASVARYDTLKASYEKQVRELSTKMNDPALVENLDATVLVTFVGVMALLSGLAGVLMWFTYRGRTWARLILGWASALLTVELVFAVIELFSDSTGSSDLPEPATWGMIPTILGGVCAVGALAALMHRDSSAFCRESAAYRSRIRQGRFR